MIKIVYKEISKWFLFALSNNVVYFHIMMNQYLKHAIQNSQRESMNNLFGKIFNILLKFDIF